MILNYLLKKNKNRKVLNYNLNFIERIEEVFLNYLMIFNNLLTKIDKKREIKLQKYKKNYKINLVISN
jgi:hypothetical protein